MTLKRYAAKRDGKRHVPSRERPCTVHRVAEMKTAEGSSFPAWWRRCRSAGHTVSIDDLSHRSGRYLGAVEYFCTECSRGETRP
jgi:hypothetical protein